MQAAPPCDSQRPLTQAYNAEPGKLPGQGKLYEQGVVSPRLHAPPTIGGPIGHASLVASTIDASPSVGGGGLHDRSVTCHRALTQVKSVAAWYGGHDWPGIEHITPARSEHTPPGAGAVLGQVDVSGGGLTMSCRSELHPAAIVPPTATVTTNAARTF